MKESSLYKVLDQQEQKAQCRNCAHFCILNEGERGKCGVRQNIKGKVYSLNYGKAVAVNIDPIEKKPFYHFMPASNSLSVAAAGCQFACASCQNWEISQKPKKDGEIPGEEVSSEKIIEIAQNYQIPSISYTYTDPIIFSEYALETMKLAKDKGIKNNWVSSGFFSDELFEKVSPYLDAINVDLKSFENEFYINYCGGRLQPVLDTLKKLGDKNIWTEVTTLVIPTLNDREDIFEDIAKFIKDNLGEETPWHISRFSGAISWKLSHLRKTPIETLKKAYETGKKAGLKYVYLGNLPGIDSENTYCPECGTLCISRTGYQVARYDKEGKCPNCGAELNIVE